MSHIMLERTVAGTGLCHSRELRQQAEERIARVLQGVRYPSG